MGLSGPCTRVCNPDGWARAHVAGTRPEVAWAVDLVTAPAVVSATFGHRLKRSDKPWHK